MADFDDIPDDLIELRIAFLAAENRHAQVCAATPAGTESNAAQKAAETAAFDTMRDLALEIHRHPWWQVAGDRYAAEVRMRQAATARSTA